MNKVQRDEHIHRIGLVESWRHGDVWAVRSCVDDSNPWLMARWKRTHGREDDLI